MKLIDLVIKARKFLFLKYRLALWNLNRRFSNFVVVSTKQGKFKIVLLEKESIGRSLYTTGEYEFELTQDVMKFLRARPNFPEKGTGAVLDIGANNGVISIGLLHTGEFSRAIAIEPEPRNFSLLENNVDINGLRDRFICLPYAVSDTKGEIQFELSDTNYGDHRVHVKSNVMGTERQNESKRQVISVIADRLDNLLLTLPGNLPGDVSLVWVDVQGYEGFVFSSGRDFLSKGVSVVAEIWPYGIQRAGMTQEQFCGIVKSLWSAYWVRRRGRFVRYPIDTFESVFDELGYEGAYENVIFTP